jgi:hypothetical protein
MNIDIPMITASSVAIVPIILAVVQAIKLTGFVKNQFAPLLSIGVGVIIAFLAHHDTADLTITLLSGVMYGLMASGLYSGLKTTMSAQGSQGSGSAQNKGKKVRTHTYETVTKESHSEPKNDPDPLI